MSIDSHWRALGKRKALILRIARACNGMLRFFTSKESIKVSLLYHCIHLEKHSKIYTYSDLCLFVDRCGVKTFLIERDLGE